LSAKTEYFVAGLKAGAAKAGIALTTHNVGGMFGVFFSEEQEITTFDQVMQCNQELFKRFFHAMLDRGVYLAPSAFEAGFVSIAHSEEDLNETLAIAEEVFKNL
jgi:glutamate-1-semialdehyde 2,1-aminomutase